MAATIRQHILILRPSNTGDLWRWDRVRIQQNLAGNVANSGTAADKDAAFNAAVADLPAGEDYFEVVGMPEFAFTNAPQRRHVLALRTQTNNTNTRWDRIAVPNSGVVTISGGVVADAAGGILEAVRAAVANVPAAGAPYKTIYIPSHAY